MEEVLAHKEKREQARERGRVLAAHKQERTISASNLQSLKRTTSGPSVIGFFHGIFRSVADVWNAAALITTKADSYNMCKLYGHDKAEGSWVGAYPTCSDCGIEIKSTEQMRRPVLLPQHVDR